MIGLNGQKTILMIYDSSVAETVHEISERIVSEHLAEKTQEYSERTVSGIISETYGGSEKIVSHSAVIFVANEMLYGSDLSDMIRILPEEYRLIPVGYPRQIAMNMVPPRLADINFVIPNEYLYENIRDSLLTDPHFYSVRNQLMMKLNQWNQSGSAAHLLTDRKTIEQYRILISSKLDQEHDLYLKKQLKEILDYLDASAKYSRRIRRSAVLRWSFRVLLILSSIIALTVFYPRINRASKRNTSSSVSDSIYADVINTVLDTEVITNQYNSDDHRHTAYRRIAESLNQVWPLSPLGSGYLPQITDMSAPSGSQYVWTADDSGLVSIWDTFTGERTEKYKPARNPLYALAVSAGQTSAVTVDNTGMIFLFRENSWQKTDLFTKADPGQAQCQCADSAFIIYDDKTIEFYALEDGLAVLKNEIVSDRIFQAELTDSGNLCYAASENGRLAIHTSPDLITTDFQASDVLLCAFWNADVVLCLKNGQVYHVKDGTAGKIPLCLKDPAALMPVSDSVILYHDRQQGTHFYDIRDMYDYGQFFGWIEDFSSIRVCRDLVLFDTEDMIIPFTLRDILPADDVQTAEITEVFDSRISECSEGRVTKARITDHGLIVLESDLSDRGYIIMDPAGYMNNDSGYVINEYAEEIPEKYHEYEESTFYDVDGIPTVIGLRSAAASELNEHDFTYLLIGMDNGTFAEYGIDNDTAGIFPTAQTELPSRSAIVSISVSGNRYLLQDETGSTWSVRSGINSQTVSGLYAVLKDKLRCAMPKQIIRQLSDDTVKGLDLKTCPGSDGKGWK